jgi:hypothetical protein
MKKVSLMGLAVLMVLSMAVFSCSDDGGGGLSDITNAPGKVGNLQATAYVGGNLLTWDLARDADGYRIYRDYQGKSVFIQDLSSDIIWYADRHDFAANRMVNGGAYIYRVVSYNGNAGANIEEVSVSVTANIPQEGANIAILFIPGSHTNADITEFRTYNITGSTGAVAATHTHAVVTITNLNPMLNYTFGVYQKGTAWTSNSPTDGTIRGTTVLYSPATSGNRPFGTHTVLIDGDGPGGFAGWVPAQSARVTVQYVPKSQFNYFWTNNPGGSGPTNFIERAHQ